MSEETAKTAMGQIEESKSKSGRSLLGKPWAGTAMLLAIYLLLYALLLITYLGVLVHLAMKAAKDGDSAPLPAVLEQPLAQPAVKN